MVPSCGTLSAITRMSTVVSVVLVYWRPRPFGRRFASVDEDVRTRPNLGLQIWKRALCWQPMHSGPAPTFQ